MDFKNKFLSFIGERKEAVPMYDEETLADEWLIDSGVIKLEHCTQSVQDPRIDKEAIESIDKSFFTDQSVDATHFQLAKFQDKPELHTIEAMCAALKKQLQAVSRKISELVLENHPSYVTELERVMDLQRSLQEAVQTCSVSRRSLDGAKKNFTTMSLNLLANYRRRQQLVLLLKSLHTIKTLQRTDNRLKELLKEENFPGAIQLSLEYQVAASTYGHYNCISELSSKLQDKLEMIDEALDVALSKTCYRFDNSYYSRIQQAYRLLGKTQVASDQLHMHYMSCIHNIAFNKVLGYVELCSGNGDGSFQKKQFADLCKFIKSEVFMPCLIDLCKALWQVTLCYRKTLDWHIKHDNEEGFLIRAASPAKPSINNNNNNTNMATSASTSLLPSLLNNNNIGNNRNIVDNILQLDISSIQYIRNKLEVGKTRLWSEIQQKVKTYLLAIDLSHFKYEEFIKVLDITNRLMKVGEEFCASRSDGLNESMRKQSINYFRNYHQSRLDELRMFMDNEGNYHQSRLDELRMFMDNEGWEVCPVKSGFTVFMLHEFKFFKASNHHHNNHHNTFLTNFTTSTTTATSATATFFIASTPNNINISNDNDNNNSTLQSLFVKYCESGSPFDIQIEEDNCEDVMVVDEDTESNNNRRNNNRHRVNHINHNDHHPNHNQPHRHGDVNSHLIRDGTISDSDEDIPDELKQEFVDEETGDASDRPQRTPRSPPPPKINPLCPLITNTTLNVCRLFGKYMQMLYALGSISYDVILCMTQLFDYYLYTVYTFFSNEAEKAPLPLLTPKFKICLRHISDELIQRKGNKHPNAPSPTTIIATTNDHPSNNTTTTTSSSSTTNESNYHNNTIATHDSSPMVGSGKVERRARVGLARLSPAIRVDSPDDLFALKSRVVATESLIFMAEQFKCLRPHLYEALPMEKKGFLEQYFLQTMNIVSDIRRPVYYPVVADILKLDSCLNMMVTQVKWDIKDIMSQHSEYVDVLLDEIQNFHTKLLEFSKYFPLPNPVNDCLWEQVSRICNQTLVEGFSNAKKCTNEGRALMMLDYQQFLIKFEKFTTIRPIPGRDYVEGYIKAFYLPENQLETWIAERKDYTPKQLLSLILCLGHISKKTRQKLLSTIEDTTNDKIKR